MKQQIKNGKLILKYCGENYKEVDQIFTINLIEENGKIPLFEFCFEFEGSNTKETVVFDYRSIPIKNKIVQPYASEFVALNKEQFMLSFDLIEELPNDGELFKGIAIFDFPIPNNIPQEIIYNFNIK